MPDLRLDRAKIKHYEKTPEGFLRFTAPVGGVGALEYVYKDGAIRKEHVSADVLKAAADSLKIKPITTPGHPDELVNSGNARNHTAGATGNTVWIDNGFLWVTGTVFDGETIAAIESGETRELSLGYEVKTVARADGEFDRTWQHFNHLSPVNAARFKGAEFKLDNADADSDVWVASTAFDADKVSPTPVTPIANVEHYEDEIPMKKWKGHEVSQELFDAIQSELTVTKTKKDAEDTATAEVDRLKSDLATKTDEATALQTSISTMQAKLDMLQPELDRLKAENETKLDAKAIDTAIKDRLDAWEQTQRYLAKDAKFDSALSPVDMKRNALKSVNDKLKLDGKDEAYINAAFEMLTTMNPVKVDAEEKPEQKTDAEQHMDTVMTAAQVGGHEGDTATGDRSDAKASESVMEGVRNAYKNASKKRRSKNGRIAALMEDE